VSQVRQQGHSTRARRATRDEDAFASLLVKARSDLEQILACPDRHHSVEHLAWQWSHDSAHVDPVTDTGRKRRGEVGTHSELCQRFKPGA